MFEGEPTEWIEEDPLDDPAFDAIFLASVQGPPPVIDRLAQANIRAITAAANRLEFLDELRLEEETKTGATWTEPDSLAWRSLRAEVAATLDIHERSAQALLDLARRLVHDFPATLQGMRLAQFGERHARILVEQSVGLPDALLAEYEERLLPYASRLVASRFERMARTLRASLEPDALIVRHREAVAQRRVAFECCDDGMAWFGAYLSAEEAVEAVAVVETIAQGLKTEDEPRTLGQIKADVFRDLLVDAGGVVPPAEDGQPLQPSPRAGRRVSPTVFVHIPALTALGRSNMVGILERFGPIDAETARNLAGQAERWLRILTDPETGVVANYGKGRYRIPEDMRQTLRIRDGVCRFVGCTRPAVHCDLDHTHAWEDGGASDDCNLAFLCRNHHRLKHGSPWNVTQDAAGSGTLTWTSPKGKVYATYADTVLPPPTTRGRPGAGLLVQQEWLAAAGSGAPPPF